MSIPLDIPPGFLKVDSPNAGRGRFTGGDKIRFERGKAEKWLGWQRFIDTPLQGKARGATSWTNQYGNVNAAFGTHLKLYAITGDDTISDITPIRASGTLGTDPFDVEDGSTTVTVNHTSHGAVAGDFVTFDSADAVGGITIDGEYQIVTRIDANSYTITHTSAATSDASGGGSSVGFAYQINIGSEGTAEGLGWGAGPWGEGTWGTPRSAGIEIEFRHWSVQEYGNDLLASPSGGGLYLWQEASDSEAEIVSNAPTAIRAMFVTAERYIMALGTSTPMTVQWPDVDDITDWTPADDNTSNTRTLQVGSRLMNGTALADGVSLVWSDRALYLFQYSGSEFVYDSRLVGTACGLIGPKAFAKAYGSAYWMSGSDFYMYAGGMTRIPNADDVKDYVYRTMDATNANKTWGFFDDATNQVRFHYCSVGNDEPDLYVDVNLDDYSWTTGTLDRTTGARFRESSASVLHVDANGFIYQHNFGVDNDGAAMEAYLTYGLYALKNGDVNVDIFGLVPDCARQSGDLVFEVYTRERPNSASNFDEQTTTLSEGEEIADLRVSGRHFGMTVRSNEIGGDFRLGTVSLETQPSGARR